MRDSFDYKLRVFIQDAIKRITGKEYAMNNITHDNTPLLKRTCSRSQMKAFSISCVFNLLICMYVQLSIVENESSSIVQANYQPANTQCATVAQAGSMVYSINSLPHLHPQLYS